MEKETDKKTSIAIGFDVYKVSELFVNIKKTGLLKQGIGFRTRSLRSTIYGYISGELFCSCPVCTALLFEQQIKHTTL